MKARGRSARSMLLTLIWGLSAACASYGQPGWQPAPCPFPPPAPVAPGVCHPYPQPRPVNRPQTTTCAGAECTTVAQTGAGIYPASNPWDYRTFPGTNFLPSVFTNMYDGLGNEMVHTLPSTPDVPYNLHDGDPAVSEINPTSPADDLRAILDLVERRYAQILEIRGGAVEPDFAVGEIRHLEAAIVAALRRGLDILEGEPVPNRAYSGFPVLHYRGPGKTKRVTPILDADGNVVGGNVDVHQIWYGQHVESDTAFIDPTPVQDHPWTVTYTVDVLNRGHDDFSPFVMYHDHPDTARWVDKTSGEPCPDKDPETCQAQPPPPHVGMDQSFFNMEEGTRTVFRIKMPPGKYLKLVYTWGWRYHPPRIQVMENATQRISYPPAGTANAAQRPERNPFCPMDYQGKTLPEIEQAVFCRPENRKLDAHGNPLPCPGDKLWAIGQIGDLSPAKRLWQALLVAEDEAARGNFDEVRRIVRHLAYPAWLSWDNRTTLPCYAMDDEDKCTDLLEPEPGSDITILYVNNTIYGQLTEGGWVRWLDWEERPATLDVTALNGDHYVHGYVNVDFGGNRGWENQFKSSVKVAGSGCWFTFGRAHWWINAGGPNGQICVPTVRHATGTGCVEPPPPATTPEEALRQAREALGRKSSDYCPGRHRIEVTYEYEPSRRLRFYQFDPFHHDVAIYSIH